MELKTYKTLLSSHGNNLSEVKKNQSNQVINNAFTRDPNYKRVYILTKDGWKFEDAKYQFHTAKSILRDDVDYYLQFRPGVHFPIGSYVIVPDDTSPKINLSTGELREPFTQPIKNRTQWWMIVDRDNANAFVRYNIIKCNWNFQWVWDGKVCCCFGAVRSANSYTSGKWTDEFSSSLDNLTGAWLPDIYHVYGNKYTELGMDDNRTIMHEQRFILSNNILDPKVYQVTKITDLSPQGIIKLSIKQDEFDKVRDNVGLGICNYYSDTGDDNKCSDANTSITEPEVASIIEMQLNSENMLEPISESTNKLNLGKAKYFSVQSFGSEIINPEWKIELNNSTLYERSADYYEKLIRMDILSNGSIMLKPGKANSLIGKTFTLSVTDVEGNYNSSIVLEVTE